MLRVGLRALAQGPVETAAVVEPDDPLLDDLDFELREPLAVRGRLMDSGAGCYYWKGNQIDKWWVDKKERKTVKV